MNTSNSLAYYLEDLWSKGFKLTDEEVRFIYFGKNYASSSDWKVIVAVETTLKIQRRFDGSFYLSLLELFEKEAIKSQKKAIQLLREKGVLDNT